jgi:ribonuclease BN (tRNA processing enzyme)
VELAHSADVRKLALFHHEPGHNDAFLDAVAEEAARAFPECFVAREGQSLRLGAPSA